MRFGLNPSEFWTTHPTAFWWIMEEKLEANKPPTEYAGGMTEAQVAAIYADAYGDE